MARALSPTPADCGATIRAAMSAASITPSSATKTSERASVSAPLQSSVDAELSKTADELNKAVETPAEGASAPKKADEQKPA